MNYRWLLERDVIGVIGEIVVKDSVVRWLIGLVVNEDSEERFLVGLPDSLVERFQEVEDGEGLVRGPVVGDGEVVHGVISSRAAWTCSQVTDLALARAALVNA